MRTQTKLMASILMLAIIGVATIFIVVSAYAATNQKSSTDFQMQYSAESNCKASITGTVHYSYKQDETINKDINGNVKGKDLISSIEMYDDGYIELKITNNQNTSSGDVADLLISQQLNIATQTNMRIISQISFNDKYNYETFTELYIRISPNQIVYLKYDFEIIDYADPSKLEGNANLSFKHILNYGQISKNLYGNIIGAEGEYPQTYVGDDLNTTLNSKTLTATGSGYSVPYWLNSSNGYIEKKSYSAREYLYNGIKVAKMRIPDYTVNCRLSTGDIVTSEQDCFFYVQPIKVVLMEVRDNKSIFMAKKLLFSTQFNTKTTQDNRTDWEYSVIREIIKDGFAKIEATQIEVKNDSAITQYNATYDYCWIPSQTEYLNWTGGHPNSSKLATDFAVATGIYGNYNADNSFNAPYWLRTEYPYETGRMYAVSLAGGLMSYNYFEYAYGVAICFAKG